MQTLYRESKYPQSVRTAIQRMPLLATEIANRWMMGWPKRVEAMLATGAFVSALEQQEQAERQAYANAGNAHLARHEIAELYGLSPEPPEHG